MSGRKNLGRVKRSKRTCRVYNSRRSFVIFFPERLQHFHYETRTYLISESTVYYYHWYTFKELHKLSVSEQNGQNSLSFKTIWIWQFSTNTKHECVPCHNSKCRMLQGKGISGIEYKGIRRTAALYSANIGGDHILYIPSPFSSISWGVSIIFQTKCSPNNESNGLCSV